MKITLQSIAPMTGLTPIEVSQLEPIALTYLMALKLAQKNRFGGRSLPQGFSGKASIPGWRSLQPGTKEGLLVLAEMLRQLFRLCQAAEPYFHDQRISDFEYVLIITQELLALELAKIKENRYTSKRASTDDARKNEIRLLKNPSSPYDTCPFLHKLVSETASFAGRDNTFESNYWLPFVRSATQLVENYRNNPAWVMVYEKGGRIRHQPPKGKK